MADYLPHTKPGLAVTRKASAPIVGGQIVAITGSGTVGPAGAGSTSWIGVAAFDAATNDNVTIYRGGEGYITASGAVAAGDSLATAANGQVATGTPTGSAFVGVASTSAASGAKVLVSFVR